LPPEKQKYNQHNEDYRLKAAISQWIKVARAFEDALERNRQRLDGQREEIKRVAAVRRAATVPAAAQQS
jgi:hypothetical protein